MTHTPSDPRLNHLVSGLLAVVLTLFFVDGYVFAGKAVLVDLVVLGLALAGVASLRHEPLRLRRVEAGGVVAAMAGAAVGHGLVTRAGFHPALAGSLAGVAVSVLPRVGPMRPAYWAPAFYVGVFSGTGAALILHGAPWVLGAGALAGVLWSTLPDAWIGVGGKMGFTGLIAAATMVLASEWVIGTHPPQLPMQTVDLAHMVAIPLALAAAVVTRYLAQQHQVTAVAASAMPTAAVAAALFAAGMPLAGPLSAAWFGGSFVGMTQATRIGSYAGIAATGGLLGLLLIRLQSPMVGWAGVLGATACTCVLASLATRRLATRVLSWVPAARVERSTTDMS